jgi:adenosylcobinamide-GDP ribazoletransferase
MLKPILQQLRLFFTAVQFFSRIPVPSWVGHSAQQLDQSARYFPLVGMCVGGFAASVLWLAAWVLPVTLAVAFSMLASVWVTGAFHEDGLSDFVDGMGGGYTREKILAIMKDSHVGAYGAIALLLALLIKFQALMALSNKHSLAFVVATLIAAHAISRLMAVSIMMTQQYVRDDESARAKPVARRLSRVSYAIALATGMAAIVLLLMAGSSIASAVSAIVVALLLRIYLGWQLQKKLGGYTGDCLGAVQQITEIGFYLGLLFSWRS